MSSPLKVALTMMSSSRPATSVATATVVNWTSALSAASTPSGAINLTSSGETERMRASRPATLTRMPASSSGGSVFEAMIVWTRDRVIRCEVVLNEGDPYNKRYWDLSILRLNQLGLDDFWSTLPVWSIFTSLTNSLPPL